MNKKLVMIVLAAVLVLAIGAAAVFAAADKTEKTDMVTVETAQPDALETEEGVAGEEEDAMEIFELSGTVIEIGEGYFVMQDAVNGVVQVNTGDDTLFEGVTAEEIALGQVVVVFYDGKMTRSLPAQVYGLKVGMYPVRGEVTAIDEGSMTIVREEIGDEVIVFLPEGADAVAVGDKVVAYTNGAMTMSLPAQTTALGIAVE